LFCFDVWLNAKRRKRFPPHCAYGAEQAGENSFPPTPFLFAYLIGRPEFFLRADGGTEIRKEDNKAVKTLALPSRARVFEILLPFFFTILKYFGNIRL
jgi:hypothetical protein